jgi:diadenosine tetraphosphatase ApaH/serine/threonine PP2A family protein phosphatase
LNALLGANVRVLILSDIHANLPALQACLQAAPAHDLVVNLGDIVGYGANPNEAVNTSRSLGGLFVRGNHDKAVSGISDARDFNPIAEAAVAWTRAQLTPENLQWLRELPHGPVESTDVPGVQFVHGSPRDEDEYLTDRRNAQEALQTVRLPITFFGHTHRQGAFLPQEDDSGFLLPAQKTLGDGEANAFELDPGEKYLINPGSIGQPRDGDWRAAFAFFDSGSRVVTFYRVPYDLKAAQQAILGTNLPKRLADRLAEGR